MGTNPEVMVQFSDFQKIESIVSSRQKIYLHGLHHYKDTQLIIERNESSLFSTGLSHHVNKISVDKVIVDDFWEFDPNFYTPTSILDATYKKYLSQFSDSDWIQGALTNNTHLFFNGRLVWDIKYPVRRSLFKDVCR